VDQPSAQRVKRSVLHTCRTFRTDKQYNVLHLLTFSISHWLFSCVVCSWLKYVYLEWNVGIVKKKMFPMLLITLPRCSWCTIYSGHLNELIATCGRFDVPVRLLVRRWIVAQW